MARFWPGPGDIADALEICGVFDPGEDIAASERLDDPVPLAIRRPTISADATDHVAGELAALLAADGRAPVGEVVPRPG